MKIGVFDSGLGGLLILKAIQEELPSYDKVYLGDTLHLPYGGRSKDAIYTYTKNAVDYLLKTENCNLIILACNTASALALRKLQQTYLIDNFPDRRILGVVIPTLESTLEQNKSKRIGLIATQALVDSNIYDEELKKISPDIKLFSQPTPLLVPLIENNGHKWITDILQEYIAPLLKQKIETLILGCTHYSFLQPYLQKILPNDVTIISQDKIIPTKLNDYLQRHPEIETKLNQNYNTSFYVSDITKNYLKTAEDIYGSEIKLKKIVL